MKDLYHSVKIGSLSLDGNLFLAPVAGYSDRAFRSVCWDCGVDFCYTEMVSSEALVRGSEKTEALMARASNEKAYGVQIFGGNAETMAKAAKIVLEKTTCELIDINGGCPVPKIIKTGAGSVLTREPEKLFQIVKAVKDASREYTAEHPERGDVPVTVKIRSGWDEEHITYLDAAQSAIEAGADAITLHARTRAQGYAGVADWEKLANLVQTVRASVRPIPVFGSGDAFLPEDCKRMLEQTQCDAVMLARGAMGNPFIFQQARQFLTQGRCDEISAQERIAAGFRQLDALLEESRDGSEEWACREMRKAFTAYSKGIPGGSRLRAQIVSAETRADYKEIFSRFLENMNSC